jgi:tRNA A37 threonylcarbamoyladenosine synthetase subunit TsaC/SUA5/YrdC
VVRALCEALGGALLSTTARDLEGELLWEPRAIEQAYKGSVGVVLDAGPLLPQPSTVVDLSEGSPQVVREGKGDLARIGLS